MWHVRGQEKCTHTFMGKVETDHLEDLAADDRMLNWNLKKRV